MKAAIMKQPAIAGLAVQLRDHTRQAGEALLPYFIDLTRRLLDHLMPHP